MGPFKCPECGVWWAGFQHRCDPLVMSTSTSPVLFGHCHGCSTVICHAADHEPCSLHLGGWSTT